MRKLKKDENNKNNSIWRKIKAQKNRLNDILLLPFCKTFINLIITIGFPTYIHKLLPDMADLSAINLAP